MHQVRLIPVLLLFASPVQAQITYDAGTPGNPPVAPSPTTQGWTEKIDAGASVTDVSPDPGFPLNAWQVNDPGVGRVRYRAHFFPGTKNYEAELVMRPLAGTLYVEIDAGNLLSDNVFQLQLRLVGQDIHVVEMGSGATLVCPGAADGYHTYHFISGASWDIAQVRFDGEYLGDLPYTTFGLGVPGEGLRWGTVAGKPGRARFHSASMDIVKPRALGESYCSPAVPHSGGIPGRMEAFGVPYWWFNDVRLDAFDLPPNKFAYFLVSASQAFVATPGGSQGNLCLGGNIGRYASSVMNSGPGGTISLNIDLANLPTSPPSSVITGDTWHFQAWFRDTNPNPTSNFTDGLTIRF